MSRLYTRNSRGRQPLLSATPRLAKSKDYSNETYQEPKNKRRKANRTYTASVKKARRRRVSDSTTADASTSADSDASNEASDEESEEDDDDDGDQPALLAPSRQSKMTEAGLKFSSSLVDDFSLPNSTTNSMFGDYDEIYDGEEDPNLSPEENRKLFERQVFADSDEENDDVYHAVDDISDSDDEVNIEVFEEQQLIASLSDEGEGDEGEDLYLNQIDGLSAYGFGDESDGTVHFPLSSQGSDAGTEMGLGRRVRFDIEAAASYHMQLTDSPTIARALLPSALPDPSGVFGGPAAAPVERDHGPQLEDDYDSDVTDDDLPEEAHHSTPAALQNQVEEDSKSRADSPFKKPAKKPGNRRGPPRGVFIDDGEKASGILDASGKIMLITHPHLLGDEFAKRYGASQTSSPDMGFEDVMSDSEFDDASKHAASDIIEGPGTDIMLASLNSVTSDPAYLGQAIGPQEAFFPTNGFDIGDFEVNPDELEGDFQYDPELGEDVIDIHDVLQFEDDSDDSDSPNLPIFMPPTRELTGLGNVNNEFSHLTNSNVTAFRRNADPTFAALNSTPTFPDLSGLSTPTTRRKRKVNESPYTSSHYKGVTPVQRRRASNCAPDDGDGDIPTPSTKRRRVMT